jgi:hypothetical protein
VLEEERHSIGVLRGNDEVVEDGSLTLIRARSNTELRLDLVFAVLSLGGFGAVNHYMVFAYW